MMGPNSRRLSVALVVDDDPAVLSAVARAVSRVGIAEIRRAAQLSEAREQLDEAVDLIVCDLCLGEENGVELFSWATRLPVPPVMIAMTGLASRSVVFELACAGVIAFLEKP